MPAITTSPGLREKLSKILGMLGSDHAGERASAGAAANRMVRDAGLTWPDVIGRTDVGGEGHHRVWREPSNDREAVVICLAFDEVLTDWEIRFCRSIIKQKRLSEKQRVILVRLVDTAREFAGAGVAS